MGTFRDDDGGHLFDSIVNFRGQYGGVEVTGKSEEVERAGTAVKPFIGGRAGVGMTS